MNGIFPHGSFAWLGQSSYRLLPWECRLLCSALIQSAWKWALPISPPHQKPLTHSTGQLSAGFVSLLEFALKIFSAVESRPDLVEDVI